MLVNGKVVRKNDTRRCLEPRAGAFGTPCKLEWARAFVHPETTKQHEQWLRKESAKSKRKRTAYRHEMMAAPQTPRKLQKSPSTFEIEPTPAPSSSSTEMLPAQQQQRKSTRQRTAVDKAGGVPICAMRPTGRDVAERLRVRAGVKKWPTTMFPKKGRCPQLPDDRKDATRLRRREEAYQVADQDLGAQGGRCQEWTHELEQPATMLRQGGVRTVEDIPIHRRCFYPKRYMPEPNYPRIVRRVLEVRQMLANEETTGLVARHHVETIHEEEHISQIDTALYKWDQALQKQR